MSCQSAVSENPEDRELVKVHEDANTNSSPSNPQGIQEIPDSDAEVDEHPMNKPNEAFNGGSVQSNRNDQTDPTPIEAEPLPTVTEQNEATLSGNQTKEMSDETYILEFSRLCASHPGERSWLSRIHKQLPVKMRPLFPLLLVSLFYSINCNYSLGKIHGKTPRL